MHQCYPGEQCTLEGQKTPPGNSGRPHVPRGHNAVPSWKRLHLFHRAVSNHDTAVHCSVGSFRGNCSPCEPSLKSTHEQLAAKFLNQIAHEFGFKPRSTIRARLLVSAFCYCCREGVPDPDFQAGSSSSASAKLCIKRQGYSDVLS